MKVAVIGATGNTRQRLTAELLKRGHHVRAVVRSPEKVFPTKGVEVEKSDLSNIIQLADVLKGVDAVVSTLLLPATLHQWRAGVESRGLLE
jgi:putative NADH-flavin reductase